MSRKLCYISLILENTKISVIIMYFLKEFFHQQPLINITLLSTLTYVKCR